VTSLANQDVKGYHHKKKVRGRHDVICQLNYATSCVRVDAKVELTEGVGGGGGDMMTMTSNQDAWYLSLLGMAEHFRTSSPPNVKCCIQCLQAVFNFKPPPRVEARTHLQLGNILHVHTKNVDLSRNHLEQAVRHNIIIVC